MQPKTDNNMGASTQKGLGQKKNNGSMDTLFIIWQEEKPEKHNSV